MLTPHWSQYCICVAQPPDTWSAVTGMQRDVLQIDHGEPLGLIGEIPSEAKCSTNRVRHVRLFGADFGVSPRSPALDLGTLHQ